MNTIIVLSHNRAHFQHYAQHFHVDKDTQLVNPHTEHDLAGLRPCAVIKLPEWFLGKTTGFCDLLDATIKRMLKK